MEDILFGLILLGLVAVSALTSGIGRGIFSLNHYKIKHKAQTGDKDAKIVYPFKNLGYQFYVTLLVLNIAANATITILFNAKVSGLFAVIFSVFTILIFGELLSNLYIQKRAVFVVARLAPALRRIISFMSPITRPIARLLHAWLGPIEQQAVYSKEQLLDELNVHKQKGSGIPAEEVRMLRTVLEFGDKKIRDVMTPRRMVQVVTKTDEVGPILMDELHRSGHSRFPVISEPKHFNFVGTLYLRDLVGEGGTRKVADVMSPHVRYIHEEESLDHALRVFLKTHHHLCVVVNNFEEFVGVLSIEDVLEEVIGKEIVDEFDAYDDLRAVAHSLAAKEKAARGEKDMASKPKNVE